MKAEICEGEYFSPLASIQASPFSEFTILNGADSISGAGGSDTINVDADDSTSVAGIAGDATGQDHFDDWASGDIIRITGELADGFAASTDVLVGTGTEGSDVAVAKGTRRGASSGVGRLANIVGGRDGRMMMMGSGGMVRGNNMTGGRYI